MGNQPTVSGQQSLDLKSAVVSPFECKCGFFTFYFFFQPGSPPSRPYEAPTPGSGWTNTPGGNYSEAGTPRDSSSAYGISITFDKHHSCYHSSDCELFHFEPALPITSI